MVKFSKGDFDVRTTKHRDDLRDRLADLGQYLVNCAKSVSPNHTWDYYVTRKTDRHSQWGAICPTLVRGFEDYLVYYPMIYYDIPQDSNDSWICIGIQFNNQRDILCKCYNKSATGLLSTIQSATNASLLLFEKLVLQEDKRNYKWYTNKLWDSVNLPEININQCNTSYLSRIISELSNSKPCNNIDWRFETVFVVKYEIPKHIVASSPNAETLFGPYVDILAPIIDYIIT